MFRVAEIASNQAGAGIRDFARKIVLSGDSNVHNGEERGNSWGGQ